MFWVFFPERFFGANVMVSVVMQQASNPVHTVANSLSLPGLQLITKKLELPVKIVFPRNLLGLTASGGNATDSMMLGLGDMAIPAMLLALVLRFDYRKNRDPVNLLDLHSSKGHRYIWYLLPGYAIGLTSNCISCWCSDSLTATCSSLSGAFYTRTCYSCVPELWEGSIMSNGGNDKARQIEV